MSLLVHSQCMAQACMNTGGCMGLMTLLRNVIFLAYTYT